MAKVERVYIEPKGRSTVTEWDPARIRSAEALARTGNLSLAADLVDYVTGDAQVQGAMKTRFSALHGLALTFEPGQGRRKRRAVKAIEAEEDWWKSFPEDVLKDLQMWGTILGVALYQLPWEADDDTERMLPRLKIWHPRFLRHENGKWFLTVADGPWQTKEIEITPGDGTWGLYTPEGSKEPWMRGAWRPLSRWVLLKDYATIDWAVYSGVKGSGTWVGTVNAGADGVSKEQRKALAEDLQAMGRDSAIALPPGWDVKLVESTAASSAIFDKQVITADEQITFAIHGTKMTTEQGGTFGKSAVLDGVRLQLIASDGESLSTCLHDQALTYWAEFNFGSRDLAPWPHWATEPPEDLKAKGDSMLALGAGIQALASLSDRVDVDAMLEENGIELVDPKKVEPKPAPLAPPPAQNVTPSSEFTDEATPAEPITDEEKTLAIPLMRTKAKRKTPGYVVGQVFADGVADEARDIATSVFRTDLKALTALVEGAKDYASLRAALADHYDGMDPKAFAEVTERALILAELGGRLSMKEDVAA